MKIALHWLNRYLFTPLQPEAVVDALLQLGFEVENTETYGYCGQGPLVVGQVRAKVPHPDSDHLSICQVDVGQDACLQIVCGATNFSVNDKVPVALMGAQLGDRKIQKAVFRGVESCGMLCSADELGLTLGRCPGLLILNESNPAIGTPLENLFGQQRDVVLDVAIPSNRGDCFSYVGIARELNALLRKRAIDREPGNDDGGSIGNSHAADNAINVHNVHRNEKQNACDVSDVNGTPLHGFTGARGDANDESLQGDVASAYATVRQFPKPPQALVSIEADACDYFAGCWIDNIAIQPSAPEIQAFLQASGLRPINNIVDATNVVLLEYGQPLHAFDADCLTGALRVRNAQAGECLTMLNGSERALPTDAMVVADDASVLSVAGIMGGQRSGIAANTQRICIECAHFCAAAIQKTSTALHLTSDSSDRFAHFVDKTRAPLALLRALQILRETNPQLSVRCFSEAGSCAPSTRVITVRLDKIQRLLGCPIPAATLQQVFDCLHFKSKVVGVNVWEVTVPTWRADMTQEVDFAEEYIRLFGTDGIPMRLECGSACALPDAPEDALRREHAALLTHAGFYECYTDTLQSRAWYTHFIPDEALSVLTLEKPQSKEHACLRFSLVPGLVNALSENRCSGNAVERLFETGHVFRVNQEGQLCELFATAFVFAPSRVRHWMNPTVFNFYEAKALVQACLRAGGVYESAARVSALPLWQPQYQGQIGLWDLRGFEADLGWLHLDFTQRWFRQDVVFAAECVWLPSRIRTRKPQTFQPYPEGPTITKDLALWVAMDTPCETVRQELLKRLKKCVQYPVQVRDVCVFDVFEDAPQAKKSLAFSIVFGAAGGGTLTDAAVQEPFDSLQLQIAAQGAYQIRKLE